MDNIMNVSEVQLSYKSNVKSSTRYKINSSQDAYELLIKCFPDDTIEYKESFKVVLLNQSNRVLGIVPISEGGISATYAGADQRPGGREHFRPRKRVSDPICAGGRGRGAGDHLQGLLQIERPAAAQIL